MWWWCSKIHPIYAYDLYLFARVQRSKNSTRLEKRRADEEWPIIFFALLTFTWETLVNPINFSSSARGFTMTWKRGLEQLERLTSSSSFGIIVMDHSQLMSLFFAFFHKRSLNIFNPFWPKIGPNCPWIIGTVRDNSLTCYSLWSYDGY